MGLVAGPGPPICVLFPYPTQILGCKLGYLDIPTSAPLSILSKKTSFSGPLPALMWVRCVPVGCVQQFPLS